MGVSWEKESNVAGEYGHLGYFMLLVVPSKPPLITSIYHLFLMLECGGTHLNICFIGSDKNEFRVGLNDPPLLLFPTQLQMLFRKVKIGSGFL